MASLSDYEILLAPARKRFDESFGVRSLQAMEDAARAELFLMYFCALGAHMTQPVEGWIRRAGVRCEQMGFTQVGRALARHASAEADHHLLMIADLRSLAARWNVTHAPSVDADDMLDQAPSPGVMTYCQLHEENIAGETPFAQVAIEYEIEMLPLRYGQQIVGRCIELLGPDIISCLSFITKHIMLDGAHTDLNARALNDLIERAPWSLSALAAAGKASLDAYASFLGDCVRLADARAKGAQSHFVPRPSLSWRLKEPPGWKLDRDNNGPTLDWLAEVRALRGKAFYEDGRRPAFRTPAGAFLDPDPIDRHAFHVLAYDGAKLVGCVRLYHLDRDGPACLTEKSLGAEMFSQMLRTLGARQDEIVEIGRWVVDPEYRAKNRDFGLSVQLAAASAVVADAIGKASRAEHGFAICAAGTKDRQDRMLTRLGMAPIAGIGPVYCEKYRDTISVLCCSSAQRLSPLLTGLIDKMAEKIGLLNALGNPFLFGQEPVRHPDPSSHPAG
ncbi:GNAT family N-acyltransferase [Rhodoblastus sp.]|jgi:hypothetical protein|uniref:GNAT family N-acyltransferase n=1 Tax=Rhodoblastus sp. TaxID=1962975 RepID=UPI0025D8C2AA|nr:GNAT family N-acyltransferase [Rhodoblastus sp.]